MVLAGTLLYSVVLHELAHGWAALLFGDPTARDRGRLSFKPWRHLDPIGTVLLFVAGFGWARPVPVVFGYLRPRRLGLLVVSAAGVVVNIIVAFLSLLLYQHLQPTHGSPAAVALLSLAQVNVALASFNLIPVPPLDGARLLSAFASTRVQRLLGWVEPFGFLLVLALLYTRVLDPVIGAIRSGILTVIALLLP